MDKEKTQERLTIYRGISEALGISVFKRRRSTMGTALRIVAYFGTRNTYFMKIQGQSRILWDTRNL